MGWRTLLMHTVIVGHGPSMLERQAGKEIDSFDFVVRQKRCQETLKHPELYGTRKDAVCGSWTIAPQLVHVEADEIWVFLDSRHDKVPLGDIWRAQKALPARILPGLCNRWNEAYRALRTPYTRPEGQREFDPLGHPHLSAGFHAILYAAEILKPESITLAGFDNIESGTFTWSVTRGPEYKQYPDHRWDIEHEMLPMVAEQLGVEIKFL
jgi:hypothetical protein